MAGSGNAPPSVRGGGDSPISLNTQTDDSGNAIRQQLGLILASPAFRNSKRYSALLRHLVEQTLAGRAGDLKERNIGVDVFERPADYDTTTDHSVRSAASEIRKRLAQYYSESGHESEIRVDLYPGSYVPQFRPSCEEPREAPAAILQEPPDESAAEPSPQPRTLWGPVTLAAAFLAGAALAAGVIRMASERPQTALDAFWAPVLAQEGPVLLCVGTHASNDSPVGDQGLSAADTLALPGSPGSLVTADAITLARITGAIQARGKSFRILPVVSTSFDDLRQGSAVLIGALNNEWVLRLTRQLRFQFENVGPGRKPFIRDSQEPSKATWYPIYSAETRDCTKDYAIVARYWDASTGRIVVLAAGAHRWGTTASGEFVAFPEHFQQLEAHAPKHWERKSMQIVLSTDVINGVAGPPNVITAHFW